MATYTWEINDRFNTVMADVSSIVSDRQLRRRRNRPSEAHFSVPLHSALLTTAEADGYPTLWPGLRTLKVRRDGDIIFNGFLWRIDRGGEPNKAKAVISCYDPMVRWAKRVVQDFYGNTINPTWETPVSAAQVIYDIIAASSQPDPDGDGTLNLDLEDGDWDTTVPPAVDVSFALANWPISIGDLTSMLFDSGVADAYITPVDTPDGYDDEIMGILNVVNQMGSDLTASVNFDYGTGDYSISHIHHVTDMDDFCNNLWYYLGPKVSETRWRGNITKDAPEVSTDPTSSRSDYGQYREVRIYDEGAEENANRKLFAALWDAEQAMRMWPRELIHAVPVGDPPFTPFGVDFDIGDTIRVNIGSQMGVALTSVDQRVEAYTVSISQNGVERLDGLDTAIDPATS